MTHIAPVFAHRTFVFFFGDGEVTGDFRRRDLLGGKGAGLAEMTSIGIPVPPGFTVSTEVCAYYLSHNFSYPAQLEEEVLENLKKVEKKMGAFFGDPKNPLLLSVRSGAPVSMPGMMDTDLNLGLNVETVQVLIRKTGNECFGYDSFRRFIQMYGDVVLGIPHHSVNECSFEELLEQKKRKKGVVRDIDLGAKELRDLIGEYQDLVERVTQKKFPKDPFEQLWGAIGAVFRSWNSERAITYRKIHGIPLMGTAVNVQAMVFGNMGEDCATGVAFTRNPATGEKKIFGEYLINAQGEDVVAGIRTPFPICDAKNSQNCLKVTMPKAFQELENISVKLESHYSDMQDIEFTIQEGKVWFLQTRDGQRSAQAAIRIAVDLVDEKIIDRAEALLRVRPQQIEQLLHPMIDPTFKADPLTQGLAASPGAATGVVTFSPEKAQDFTKDGKPVILVRMETSAEDIHGMHVAKGILTARGGLTSHAAVVARGMGKCCIVGCHELQIYYQRAEMIVHDQTIKEGDLITLDGTSGKVYLGEIPTTQAVLDQYYSRFMSWADEIRRLRIRTNADTPCDSRVAREFGAEGIGLCRTEHMFFDSVRIDAMREMILADSEVARKKALSKLMPMQKKDFKEIFREMYGYPVTIRLLDPPLHEFLPHSDKDLEELSHKIDVPFENLVRKKKSLAEFNPMLGFRGCRLGIAYPEIYQMQVHAIMEAACELVRDERLQLHCEIMVPIVGNLKEFKLVKDDIVRVCKEIQTRYQVRVPYAVGTMIELPRAALLADQIATEAEFFSFGTNDLTQTTLGISRDDAGFFLPKYVEKGIFEKDPFVSIDEPGVGKLIQMAVDLAKATRPGMSLGICGEHGGDSSSIEFCHRVGLDYVSCSPYRVPQARLSAAQAVLKNNVSK